MTYVYQYDDKYQLTEATWGTSLNFSNTPASFTTTTFNKEKIKHPTTGVPAYDANGNIQYLERTNKTGVLTEKFQYNYTTNTNKLASITNTASGTQTYASYTYDALGQLTYEDTQDPAQKKYILYDVTGKVVMVSRNAAFTQPVVEYVYNELGQRIVKKLYNAGYDEIQRTYYVGDVIYTQPFVDATPGVITVQEYEIDGGSGRIGIYYRPGDIYAYQLTDHLGNTRAVVARSGSNLQVRMYSDYYPYGLAINEGADNYRYGYQGQYAEKDPETDWNAFELRMYDSKIARWLSIDPKNQFHSPYVSMGNNPVNGVDPDGGKSSPIFDITTGEFLGVDSEGYQGEILFMSKSVYNSLSNDGNKIIDHNLATSIGLKIGEFPSLPLSGLLPFTQETAKVLGAAFSHVLSQLSIEGFSMSDLYNGKVSTYGALSYYDRRGKRWNTIGTNSGLLDEDALDNALATFDFSDNRLTYNLNYMQYLNTVENIQNLAVHEIGGHKINGFNASVGKHRFSYELQIKHPTFMKTTSMFQEAIRGGYRLAIQDDAKFR